MPPLKNAKGAEKALTISCNRQRDKVATRNKSFAQITVPSVRVSVEARGLLLVNETRRKIHRKKYCKGQTREVHSPWEAPRITQRGQMLEVVMENRHIRRRRVPTSGSSCSTPRVSTSSTQ